MDKETLSHYGWIVILVLILSVLLALATPFGNFIAEGFKAAYAGFGMVSDNALGIIIPGAEPHEPNTIYYYQPYRIEIDGGVVEYVFHKDGAVDLYVTPPAEYGGPYGDIFPSGTAVYGEGTVEFDGMVFTINEDGTAITAEDGGTKFTFTLIPTPIHPLYMNTGYINVDGEWEYVLSFKADGSGSYKEYCNGEEDYSWDMPAGEFKYFNEHFEEHYYDDSDGQTYIDRHAVYPDGTKIITYGNIYVLSCTHPETEIRNKTEEYTGDIYCKICGQLLEKGSYLNGDLYAIVLNNSSNSANSMPMIYARTKNEVKVGDMFNSATYGEKEVIAVYTGFETDVYEAEYMDEWIAGTTVPWYEYAGDITSVTCEDSFAPNSTKYWYFNMQNCTKFELSKIDTSKVTDMSHMFDNSGVINASSLNVSSSVTTIERMFYSCENLTTAPILKNATSLKNMSYAFYWTNISKMPEIPRDVQNFYFAFAYCRNMRTASPIISNEEISMDGIFIHCDSLGGELILDANIPGIGNSSIHGAFYGTGKTEKLVIKTSDISIASWIRTGTADEIQVIVTLKDGIEEIGDNYATMNGVNQQTANSGSLTLIIPEGVKYIRLAAFESCLNLDVVYLPSTLKEIEGQAFQFFGGDFYYEGTMAEWNEIETGSLWCGPYSNLSYLNGANQSYVCATVHCSDGDVLIYPKDLR